MKPVFTALYYAMPLYASFRNVGRFNWFMTLYIAMLAGIGFDVLVRMSPWRRWPTVVAIASAACLGLIALLLMNSANAGAAGAWGHFVEWLSERKGQVFNQPGVDGAAATRTGLFAASQFAYSAVTMLCMAGALLSLRWSATFRYLLAAVTIAELTIFANGLFAMTQMLQPYPTNWTTATEEMSRDSRVLHPTLEYPNTAMIYGFDDVYGYDPVSLKRFSDFCAATQDQNPDQTNFVTQIERLTYPKLFQLLRCELVLFTRLETDAIGSRMRTPYVLRIDSPLPRLLLVPRYVVEPSRDKLFDRLRRKTLIRVQPFCSNPRQNWSQIRQTARARLASRRSSAHRPTGWKSRPIFPSPRS